MTELNPQNYILKIPKDQISVEIPQIFTTQRLYTYLVGAGISMDPPSCIPSARQFVGELFKYYAPEEEIDNLEKLDSLRYEFLVEKVQSLFDKEIKFLDYLDEVKEPNANHIFLVNMIMRYNYVITTNFDYLIEIALKKAVSSYPAFHSHHKKVMLVISKDDYKKNVNFQFPIIKIHGSKRDYIHLRDTRESLITTISALGKGKEKGKTFAIEPYKKKIVDTIMANRDLVVMGYSGSDDFDISPMLRELKDLKRLIWIDHDNDPEKLEIYKYKPIDTSNLDSISKLNSLSKLDFLLIELSSRSKVEVYKIRTNTLNFVKNKLGPIYNERFYDLNKKKEVDMPKFSDFMKNNHFEAPRSTRYRLAHEIYNELGLVDSAERTALKGLDHSKIEKNSINELYFTNAIGLISLTKGEIDKALEQFNKTLSLTETLNKINKKIAVLINLGEYYRNQSDLKNSFKYLSEASNLATNETPDLLKFSIFNSLGTIYQMKGDIENALKNLKIGLRIAEKMGDLSRKALCYNNLAGIYFNQGRLDPALNNATEALKIDELLGNLEDMASNLNTIGNIYSAAGYFDKALDFLNRAYSIADKIKKKRLKALAVNAIGVIHFNRGELDMAMKMYEEAYKIRKEIEDLSGQATILNNMGMVHRRKRNFKKAIALFTEAIGITENIGEKTHLGLRYANLGSIYEANRDFDKALNEYKKAISIEQSQKNLHGVARQLFNAGGVLGDMGKYDECIKNYSDALNIMEQLRIKPGIAQGLSNLGLVYFKFKKDFEKAIPLLERAIKIYKELNNSQMVSNTQKNLDYINKQRDLELKR